MKQPKPIKGVSVTYESGKLKKQAEKEGIEKTLKDFKETLDFVYECAEYELKNPTK